MHNEDSNRIQINLTLGGRFDFHVHVHFDHAALGAKLREATGDLKAAVDANQPQPPEPQS